jgi:hypothetical protein
MKDAALSFNLVHATTREEYALGARLRSEVYRQRLGLDPSHWLAEAERDREGHLFILYAGDTPVATGRALSIHSRLCELRDWITIPTGLANAPDMCEIGRIAARSAAGSTSYGPVLLGLGAQWLLANTHFRRYIAYCRTPLIPLYRRIGGKVLDVRFKIPGRGDAQYVVIVGQLEQATIFSRQFSEIHGKDAARTA